MARVSGAQTRLYMKPQGSEGTAATGNYTQLGFISAELGTVQDLIDNPVIGLTSDRDPGDPFQGQVDTSGNVVVPINEEGFGHWLRLLFGAPSTSGSPSDYTHNFDSGTAIPPWNTIELDLSSALTNRYSLLTDVRGGDLQIDFSPNGPATARINIIGKGETTSGSAGSGTPSTVAGNNFSRSQGSISRAGSALGQVTGGTLTYSNNLEAVRTIRADRLIEGTDPGIASASGEIRMRLSSDAEALIADAEDGTPFELDFRLERSGTRYINFNMGRVFLSAPRKPITGPNGIDLSFNWRAALNTGDGYMLRVTLANGVSGYA